MLEAPTRRKTSRAKLVGIAVFCAAWVGAGDGLHSAIIETSVIPDLAEPAAGSDAGLAERAAAGGSFIARLSALAEPCSAADESGRRPESCPRKGEPAGPAALSPPDLPFGPAAITLVAPSEISAEISAAASDLDFTARQFSFGGLQTLTSGTTPELLDELIAEPDEASDTALFWSGKSDTLLDYMVSALAVLALSVAGLLLRDVVLRRRRATLARRLKRSFRRSARRRLNGSSRPGD